MQHKAFRSRLPKIVVWNSSLKIAYVVTTPSQPQTVLDIRKIKTFTLGN